MFCPRRTCYVRGLPFLLCLIICCASVTSNGDLHDSAQAPTPSMAANTSTEYSSTSRMRQDIRQQQNLTLVFVVGVTICLAIFALSYCIAYRMIMARQREMTRLHRSRVRGIELDDLEPNGAAGEERSGRGGLDPLLVSSLRTVEYRSKMLKEKEMMKEALQEHEETVMILWVKECAVCLSEYEEGEAMKVLPVCGHCFHENCIDMWLFSHSTCPICRLSLVKPPPPCPAIAAPPSPSSTRAFHVAVDMESSARL